ncbi:putative SAM-dependent methyltransferase [Aureibacillus halotolerans]|uniref:Putative SAM-dependent methyltransferase n=2 Tax=Aureibacillus halotolerans TaxID=1508390 RepID=A0A4R6U0J4_9BACI|nr:putative SAM-dependent methyltransferase [Aureibacillus halotolerans]
MKIVIGAGDYDKGKDWLHTQEEELNLLNASQWEAKFPRESLTAILAEHVWEHLTYDEGIEAAKTCFPFLKPGGHIRCAVPDGYFQNESYQHMVQVGGPGPKDHPAAGHKILYNFNTLTQMFQSAGYKVNLLEYCNEQGIFHSVPWDTKDGFIYRSALHDHRNQDGELQVISLIVDAIKPSDGS